MKLDDATIKDLQWDEILQLLTSLCHQPTARERCEQLIPLTHKNQLENALQEMHEIMNIFQHGAHLPSGEFHEIPKVLQLLQVRDAVLSEDDFQKLVTNTQIIHDWLLLKKEVGAHWKQLEKYFDGISEQKEILEEIFKIFTPLWKIRDDASPALISIRDSMQQVRRQITKNFQKVLRDLQSKGYIAATEENFQNDRKVLAVISSYKKKVGGIITGSSKTGSITFIEPSINIALNNEMEILKEEELKEIRKILQQLTQKIRHRLPFFRASERLLIHMDFLRAKSRLGGQYKGIIPQLTDAPALDIQQGVHPLLFIQHQQQKKITKSQNVQLHHEQRMLVISGPNAGGKSVTMKMVGLIQIMFQCAIPVPVKRGSTLGIFHHLLSDIGDHQSIENQLSTYSYRLQRMRHFLSVANRRTLLLLDEFGTGSDPDLGGALAEVFFEELYHKKALGIITTHYTNIKHRAEQLPHAINGHMQFDTELLQPQYQLLVGKAGPSFTYEVALAIGIESSLIENAKKKLKHQKLAWDEILLSLEKEKQQLEKTNAANEQLKTDLEKQKTTFFTKEKNIQQQLERRQAQYDKDQHYVVLGKRMQQFIQGVKARNKNAELWEEMKKYILMEHAKLEQVKKKEKIKKQKAEAKAVELKDNAPLNIADLVRIKQTKQVGMVTKIEEKGITVIIGNFKTLISRDKLQKI
jgi:DNA mismatch repair protein MutS2